MTFPIGLALAMAALFSPVALAQPVTLITEPVITIPPEPPRDQGHRISFAELKALSSQVQSASGASSPKATTGQVLLGHPLRKGLSNTNPGFYGISNYVDQDPAAPDQLLDYDCGERTYDLEDGTNHNGVDYFNFPFAWRAMQQDASIVVAAADGVIIQKNDGEPDKQCAFSESADANQVAIEHADGSVTVYTHLKRNTTTARGVGDTVEKGDYLGVVGSSGFSTGPHLHFGVYNAQGGLIEPHAGECNTLNDQSWWEDQEAYHVRGINFLATHSAFPEVPPCPGVEQPNLDDTFSPGDGIVFSVYVRDYFNNNPPLIEIFDPNGIRLLNLPLDSDEFVYASALNAAFELGFSQSAISGAYTYRVTYGNKVYNHTFYINSGPPNPPNVPSSNNARNGLWFDPGLDGEGYNFVTTPSGTIIYFYGNDASGNRLWLISDLIPGSFNGTIEVTMFESTGGSFGSPVPSNRGLSVWGTLIVNFSACDSANAALAGADGVKNSQLIKLAGVAGTGCDAGNATPDSPWSGLWFDTSDEGEGYNLVVATHGAILYYYGFDADGDRLWLISDLVVPELQVGEDIQVDVYAATGGDFNNPAPSSELAVWGTATITLENCGAITIVLVGNDGNKTSATTRLAGVIGLNCSN